MPTFKITGPNGESYEVTAPEGASESDVLAYAQKNFKMAAAPKSKPFGQQLNDAISDMPRQVGLSARYGLQGVGDLLDTVSSPIRAGLNAILPNQQRGVADVIAGNKARPAIEGRSGERLADLIGLPKPKPGMESAVGTAAEFMAGSVLPVGLGASLAKNATGTTQAVGRMMAANPAQQLASAGTAGLAGGYTRETGGGEGAQLLASLAGGIAAPVAMNGGMRAAQKVGQAAQRMTALPAAQQHQIDITINTALQGGQGGMTGGMTLADMPADVASSIRADVAEAMKLGSLKPDAIRRLADYRWIGAQPSRAGLTLDVGDITRQKNLAKIGANSKDQAAQGLAQMENSNNNRLTQVLNEMGAGTPDDKIAGAGKVMGALGDRNERAQGMIKGLYDQARATGGRAAALDHETFAAEANRRLDDALLGGKLPSDVRNVLTKEWNNVVKNGEPPLPTPEGPPAPSAPRLTVDTAEQIKTRIGELQRASTDPAERKALGLVRGALDDAPLLPGQDIGQESIDAFNKARALNRKWMGIVEKTPALQAVREGVEPDKFVEQFIIGKGPKANVMDVAKLKSSIKADPDAMQAVREQILADLKRSAKSGAEDEIVNFSQSGYNKRLQAIGDRKLALFFKPDEIEKMKAVGRVASYEQVQPKGSAVNNSNTASAGFNAILDHLINSPLIGKIPFGRQAIAEPLQNVVLGSQVSHALSAPRALIDGAALPQAQPSLMRGISPIILNDKDTDEARKRRGLLDQ